MTNSSKKRLTNLSVYFALIGVFMLALFVALTLLVRADFTRSFDFDMTVRLQDDIPLRLDGFFSYLSVIGRFEWTTGFLLLLLIIKRKIIPGFFTVGFWGFAHVLELIGKSILEQPGPPRMFLRSLYSEFPGLHVFTEASYPSGHSIRIVFLALLAGYIVQTSPKIPTPVKLFSHLLVLSITFLVLISRISLGEHWTTDVFGGIFLGASMGLFSLTLYSLNISISSVVKRVGNLVR